MEQLMAGRDQSSGPKVDPDDWFSDADTDFSSVPEPPELTVGDVAAAREPTGFENVVEPEEPTADSQFARRRLAALAVAMLLLVVGVVVAFVAFGGESSSTPTVATTTSGATTTTPAATVPATPAPSTPAVTLPTTVLGLGATGAAVKTLQRALARAGHSPGPIDGHYGPKTQQAVSAFQRSAGITDDGIYGPKTKKALQQNVNSG
jgi:hypothetical protein